MCRSTKFVMVFCRVDFSLSWAVSYTACMDLQPLPSILAAIERGRHNRGLDRADRRSHVALIATANRWSYIRAVVLTLVGEGWSNRVIGEELGISSQRASQLKSEACDAVLRSAASSAEAEAACACFGVCGVMSVAMSWPVPGSDSALPGGKQDEEFTLNTSLLSPSPI
jgi:hypothetical protein